MNAKFADNAEKIDVKYVAQLARIDLKPDEIEHFQSQLEQVLEYVNQLRELDVEGIEPTAHAIPVHNVYRKDEPRPCLDHDQVMSNAPSVHGDEFRAPKIIE